eukprot:scaffold481955_cov17-Prasinocladus_malaysianus.AAC.1
MFNRAMFILTAFLDEQNVMHTAGMQIDDESYQTKQMDALDDLGWSSGGLRGLPCVELKATL